MVDFIGVYDNTISSKYCKKIIDFFEDNKDLQFRGRYFVEGQTIINTKVKVNIKQLSFLSQIIYILSGLKNL